MDKDQWYSLIGKHDDIEKLLRADQLILIGQIEGVNQIIYFLSGILDGSLNLWIFSLFSLFCILGKIKVSKFQLFGVSYESHYWLGADHTTLLSIEELK